MVEKAALSFSAFLTSSAVTQGYSPYSKKLGKWCSRTNVTNESRFSFPSSRKPSRLVNTVLMPLWPNNCTASSVYSSGRPHFALCAGHLYDLPIGPVIYGEDPLRWHDDLVTVRCGVVDDVLGVPGRDGVDDLSVSENVTIPMEMAREID